jgi:hypothetical protein
VGTVPFAVPGDFNRAFDVHGQGDHLWQEIDDGDPAGLDLWRLPFRQESECWRGAGSRPRSRSISWSSTIGLGSWPTGACSAT